MPLPLRRVRFYAPLLDQLRRQCVDGPPSASAAAPVRVRRSVAQRWSLSCGETPAIESRTLKSRHRSASPPVVPGTPSTAICSGLPVHRGGAHPLLAWAPNHARQFTAHRSGQRQSVPRKHVSKPTGSPARRGTGAAITNVGRRNQCRVWLSGSEMPWLQHVPDRCPRYRAPTEGNAGP